jgi:biopolymer transport protein ExbD
MSSRTRSRRKHPAVELNITAFMNLMVVLVPFLLMTAVFTHITILDLNLPKPGSQQSKDIKDPPFELRITIRKEALILSDNKGGLIKKIDSLNNGHNYGLLKQVLKQVKARFPDKTNLTILSEQDTFYDDLIQVMDSTRSFSTMHEGELVQAELFPDISIGDAAKK